MTFPTVHLNGTSADDLLEKYQSAYGALMVAIEALQESYPNARDYYVQGPTAYADARREHETRLHRMADTALELLQLLEWVYKQQANRERAR